MATKISRSSVEEAGAASVAPALVGAALRYARRGWLVFPCRPRGKEPLTPHGFKDATTEEPAIRDWWTRWPSANVAVATGRESGIVVLDVDVDDERGIDGWEALRALGDLPRTASVKTPRGGAHLYFAHPGGDVPCSVGQLGRGLDVRGDGGFVLAPPSVGESGRRWEPDEQAPVQPLPAVLTAQRETTGPRPVSEWRELAASGRSEGSRNDSAARLAGHLLAHAVDPYVTLHLLEAWDAHRNQPPLGSREIMRVVESIATREARRVR
jgi:hypothetical protein